MTEATGMCDAFEISGPAGHLSGWTLTPDPASSLLPVLFVHPINMAGACWLEVARRLDPSRLCLMPDLRGHGASDPDGPFGLEHWAADCFAALDSRGIVRAHVVGGSLGGPIAVAMAAEAPERVASITGFGTGLAVEGNADVVLEIIEEKGVRQMFRELIPALNVAPGTRQEVIDEILEIANPNDERTVAAIWRATVSTDVTGLAAAVTCPVFVANGEFDGTFTPEAGTRMASASGGEFESMPGVGHLPMFEDPELTASLVSRFLRQNEGGADDS